jgi:hypothetical protein
MKVSKNLLQSLQVGVRGGDLGRAEDAVETSGRVKTAAY